MKIEINLFINFTQYLPENSDGHKAVMEFKEGTSVRDVLLHLEIPIDKVKLVFVNGIHTQMEDKLKDGDRMGVFPPLGGG